MNSEQSRAEGSLLPHSSNLSSNASNSAQCVDVQLGQVVLVKGEKIIGVVSYLGNVHWDSDSKKYVGLTLSDPVENGHNGSLKGKKYFECNDKHGLIIPSQHISRRIDPPELLQKVTTLNNAFKECYNQSQQIKQKYLQIRQALTRVEGENQNLRQQLEYYERAETERELQREREWQYMATSQSRTPDLRYSQAIRSPPEHQLDVLSGSPSPSPQSITSVGSTRKSANSKRRTFQPPLPPLPSRTTPSKTAPTSPLLSAMAHNEEASKSFGIPTPTDPVNASYHPHRKSARTSREKKRAYKSRKYEKRKRSHSNTSYKSFKSRGSTYKSQRKTGKWNRSDISRSTMCSQSEQHDVLESNEEISYNDHIDMAANSPMPLSIGDEHSKSNLGSSINNFHALPPKNPNMHMNEFSNNSLNIINSLNNGMFSANTSVVSEEQPKYNMEEESHDCGDMSLLDVNMGPKVHTQTSDIDSGNRSDVILVEDEDEILFPIIDKNAQMVSNDSRHTNTPKSYNSGTQYISKFVPRDQEDVDDDDLISNTFENNKYNHEEAELDIDQITMRSMSFVSRATDRIGGTSGINDDLKLPDVIKEGDEDEEKSDFADMNMNGDDGLVNIDYDNHLSPHIIDDDDADSGDSRNLSSADLDNGMDEVDPVPMDDNRSISSSESIEFQPSAFQSPPPFDDARSPTPPKTKFEQQDEDDDIEIDGTPLPNRDSSTQIRTFQPYHKHASVPARDLYSHSHGIQSFQPDRRRSQHVTPTWQQQTQPHINVHPNHSPSHTTPSPHENMNGGLVQRQSLNSSHSKNSKRSRNSGNSKNSRYSGNSSRSKQGQQQQQPQQHSQLRLEHNVYSVPTPNLHMNEDMMMHDPLASVGLYGDEDINAGNLFSDSQSGGRYSNTPSYTPLHKHNESQFTSTTISNVSPKKPNDQYRGHQQQGHFQNENNFHKKAKKRQSHILQPAHIRLPGKFAPDKKFQSQPAPATKVVHWGDEDQGDEFALDIINKMGNAGGGAGDHFDHHRRNNNIHYTNNNNNTDRDSMNSSRSNSNYSNNSSAKLRPSAQQKLLANGYGKNSQGNFFNITKRKSMGDHKKKAKRRMSRSRTFVSNTNGKKYNVFEQKKDKDTSHLNQSNVNNNFDEEKSHQPLNPSPKQSPLMVPMNGNNNINMIPRSAPQHPVASPTDNVPHQITLDDFELEHQIDEMNMNNHNRASNNVHKYNNNKPGHQAYYSTHINISQRNSMIPASSPTIQNYQSESVAKEWNRKRSKNKLSGLKQHNKKRKSLKRNFNINGNNGINGYEPNHHQHDQHINVHFNTLENMGISKSAPAPDPSQHRNLGSLTHTELKGFLEADNLFHYNGYNNSNIVQ